MKFFAEDHSVDWVEHLGHGKQPTVVIDADLATVVGASDKIILVGRGKNRWLLLIEMLASYKDYIPERTHWHSTLLAHRHSLPVRSVIVLLRPEADGPAMTGSFERGFPGEMPYDIFRYRIVRIWQISVQIGRAHV